MLDKETVALLFGLLFGFILFSIWILTAEGYKIVTFGDISCNSNSQKTMNNTIAYLQKNNTDMFVFLGDADYGGSYETCVKDFFINASQYTTVRFSEGNHDNFDIGKVWVEYHPNITLIGINSEKDWYKGSKQYNVIVDALQKPAKHKIVFSHIQVLPEVCETISKPSKAMCGFYSLYNPIFKEKGVDCVVQAHTHTFAIFEKGSICYPIYGVGGAGAFGYDTSRYDDRKYVKDKTWGFVVINITSDREFHTFHMNDGTTKKFTFTD